MTFNYEVFLKDPTTFTIPNEGVTKIFAPETEQHWQVLRYELASFVCEGEYHHGLERVLSAFMGHLGQAEQPAVWVSGFYGSGKSHFVRVLEYLWRDVELPDGARARSLVKLPGDVADLFKELTTAGKRAGGLWSAAGTLGASAGKSVRLALLAVALRSAGLPEKYPRARFVIWLRNNGYYQAVRSHVEAQGKSFDNELVNLYVSPHIANGLLNAYPGFAASPAEARSLIKAQYPDVDDISTEDLLRSLEDVLELQSSTPGRLPLTLLVFDELQQFLGEDPERTGDMQEAVQACSARFGSRLLFVATGQAALQAMPQLSKLQGRFTVRVTLEDKDVERVVRDVVLRKQPDKMPLLQAVLEQARSEIDRHLAGTGIAATANDKELEIADYPLLPTRRRFWEKVLRAIDPSGTGGQLRTQLRIVNEATREVASALLGTVLPADAIYDQQKANMLQSGVLRRDLATMIAQQDDNTPAGKLRSRLCATIFLIGKLETKGPGATGVRATPDMLADLLVTDLLAGSAGLRQQIPALLDGLFDTGVLMPVGDEYRLQTPESAEWEADYRKRYSQIKADDSRIASDRADAFRKAASAALKGLVLTQGASKTPRKVELHFGQDQPKVDGSAVPVWVRDEWMASDKAVREDAQAAGVESAIVFVLLPRRSPEALREALAGFAAARECVDHRPTPNTAAGLEARQAMVSRQEMARASLDGLVAETIGAARVFLGGGAEISENTLAASIRTAAEAALARLYPKFGLADQAQWGQVVKRAQEGSADALAAVGYSGDADKHPACQEVRQFVGGGGRKGSDVRKHFTGSLYGWSQDAVDGALLALTASGALYAKQSGQAKTARTIIQSQIGVTDFYSQGVTVTAVQRIAVRKLISDLGLPVKPNDEAEAIPLVLQKLIDLAEQAGGAPPLPEKPNALKLVELRELGGNEQFVAVYEAREQLLAWHQAWTQQRSRAAERLPRWDLLQHLLQQAAGLPVQAEIQAQATALRAGRGLLNEPDPLHPLLDQLTQALREALAQAQARFAALLESSRQTLEASPAWQQIEAVQRQAILKQCGIAEAAPAILVGSAGELLATLEARPLAAWENMLSALPGRFEQARLQAARLLEPQAVRIQVRPATLKTAAEVDAYLAELRSELMAQIDQGKPVIL